MKKVAIGLIMYVLILLVGTTSTSAQFSLPTWPDGVDPSKDPIILLWVMTDRYHYTTDEIFSPQVSVSDPSLTWLIWIGGGMVGGTASQTCQFALRPIPKYVQEAKGGQFCFNFIERKVGTYRYQAFMTSLRGVIRSNVIEITISAPPAGKVPKIGNVKYESLTEDDDPNNTLWFERFWNYWGYYDEKGKQFPCWSQPFRREDAPRMAPRTPQKTNFVIWGKIKSN